MSKRYNGDDEHLKKWWYEHGICAHCGADFYYRRGRGPRPKYCSDACKQREYRKSKASNE
jgi:hypothetical protein